MVFYLGLLVLFSALYFHDIKMFAGSFLLVLFYSIFDVVWTCLRDKVLYFPLSSWISGLVLAIAALPNPSPVLVIVLPLFAVATKQLLHFGKNRHVFNPAASALAIIGIFTPVVSWWGVAAARWPAVLSINHFDTPAFLFIFIVAAALVILWRQNRWHVTLSFFGSYIFFLGVLSLSSGMSWGQLPYIFFSTLLNSVIIFFATVMLVEPITSTFANRRQEIFYGILVGGMAILITYISRKFNLFSLDPLVYGLLGGNLIASLCFLSARNVSASVAGGLSIKKSSVCANCDCKRKITTLVNEPSYWFRDAPVKTIFPTLKGENNFDVAIIGGGIAGISAAYFLAKAGVKVAVVEANTLGSGDSGYTTACATRFLENIPATLAAWESSDAAIDLFKKIIEEEKINCDWQDIDAFCFTRKRDQESLDNFVKIFHELQTKDKSFAWLDKDQASMAVGASVSAAYRKSNSDGIFHMRKFLFGLAQRAKKYGAVFFENSEVVNISLGEKIIIKTKEGSIVASQLVVATGIPSVTFFPEVAKILRSSVSYVIDVKFTSQTPLSLGFFCDDLTPYHYYRSVGNKEFLLGGEDWNSNEPKPSDNPHEKLVNWLSDFVGSQNKFEVINSWQGSIFSTPDTLPLVGHYPTYGKNVIFLTGWAGNGTAQGLFGASIAADLATNKNNSWQKLFACDRNLVWSANNKSSMSNDKNFDNLAENKGEIVEIDGKKLAVIKKDGEVKKFSAICPHMGCEVGWNDSEKTWDCPCHGSRFKSDGSLLNGPAKRGLDSV